MRILFLEDEDKLAGYVKRGLTEQGYAVEHVKNGDTCFGLATTQEYDALVLDIMVPGRDGLSILRGLRKRNIQSPVILLTARGESEDILEGLDRGADDYITKPFHLEVLLARLRSVMRRSAGYGSNLLKYADLTMDLLSRTVTRGEKNIELTMREFALLEYLMRTPGRVLTRTQLCEHVWNYKFDSGTNIVDVNIRRLRQKIDDDCEQKLIQTVRGIGYSLRETP